jgi:L-cysteine:1D-myo-inositol 2-amino-2-deoxy-alpha-D-glucopyranoside ligase
MHVAMVFMNGSKMSKSLGNLEFVDRLRKQHDPRAIRLALIANHYRQEWEWTSEAMPNAHNRLQSWSQATKGDGSACIEEVRNALDDDLNVPAAIALLDDAAKSGHSVTLASRLLGVDI